MFLVLILLGMVLFFIGSHFASRRRKERAMRSDVAARRQVAGDRVTRREADAFVKWLDQNRLPFAGITVGGAPPSTLHASRIGGPLPVAPGGAWPLDRDGAPMAFLVQINFAETPPLPDYPTSGVIQVFAGADDLFGADFDELQNSQTRVLWHENPGDLIREIAPPESIADKTPFQSRDAWARGRAIAFSRSEMRPNYNVWNYHDRFSEIAGRPDGEALIEQLDEEDARTAHYVGGYPHFTQCDPRSADRFPDFDRVLFHMGCDDDVMWGDCGEAMFMIRRDDLKARRFDRILFSWDCC